MSSNIIPVLEHASTAYIVALTEVVHVIENSPTPEHAASLLRKAAPPATVKTAVVAFGDETLEIRQKCVKALQNEGYTNIESINIHSIVSSTLIFGLPLNCAIGEPVFISWATNYVDRFEYPMYVVRKCESGWQIIETIEHPKVALSKYPSARNIVIYKNSPKFIKSEVRKLFPGLKLHFFEEPCCANANYASIRINNNIIPGYEILPFCDVILNVAFSNKSEVIPLTDRVPPFTIDKIVDVGDAPIVEISGRSVLSFSFDWKLKTFKFKSKAFRKVLVTVGVDKTLVPTVALKTSSTYKPRDRQTPVVYAVWIKQNRYHLFAISEDHHSDEGSFTSTADLFIYILKSSTIPATKAIFFVFGIENTISELQEFRDFCAKIEVYQPVKFIFNDSLNLSFTFDRAGIPVLPGQTVAVLTPRVCYAVQQDGRFLQVLDWFLLQDLDFNKYDIDTVVVSNVKNTFTQSDLEHLRLKCYPRAVIVLPGTDVLERPLPKFFWSRVNGTDFGGNLCTNFGFFDVHIKGDGGVAETVVTRFRAVPYTVTADVKVADAKTLNVILLRSEDYSGLLQKFDVPNGAKAVRFTIRVESVCDITASMDVIDETEVTRQPERLKVIGNRGRKPSTVDLMIQFGTKCKTVSLTEQTPFTINEEVDVGDTSEVTVHAVPHGKVGSPSAVKTLKFKKPAFRKVSITVNVDQRNATELTLRTASTYKPAIQPTETSDSLNIALSQLKLDPPSTTDLTFTSDNRVLINAGKTYFGDKVIPAYVRLQNGMAPEVGQKAFDALKKHPGSVFYGWLIFRTYFWFNTVTFLDITRLLAADFDPDHPDPSWRFKTTRDSDGKVLVHGDDDVVTLPIVLFGMIVKCTLIYIKEHQKSHVPILGIRLPAGCVISDADLKTISPLIGVELILLA
uniref:DNA helicase n=1 Tax=Panagrellus redivivus TaxID=6233 RepID=A0A7E4ULP0_PANRE